MATCQPPRWFVFVELGYGLGECPSLSQTLEWLSRGAPLLEDDYNHTRAQRGAQVLSTIAQKVFARDFARAVARGQEQAA